MTVVIAGGGIGGLTLALSLHQVGIAAVVYESVAEIVPLGVGINLQPNAVRELTELGFADELHRCALELRNLEYCNKFGQRVWIEPRGLGAGYAWPQYSIHRGYSPATCKPATNDDDGYCYGHTAVFSGINANCPPAVQKPVRKQLAYSYLIADTGTFRERALIYDLNVELPRLSADTTAPDQGYPTIRNIKMRDLAP